MPQKDPGSTTRIVPSPKDVGSTTKVTGAARNISPKTIELGRSFLSALFMGLRTAQIHDPANKAFERAVQGVRVAADQLYAVTNGFTVNFVEDSTFLNGVRLRFEGGQFDAMRTLRHILESKELGGIEMRAPPSYDAIRKLLLMFSSSETSVEVNRDDLLAVQIGVLGVQRFSDQAQDRYKVDRRVFAVQSYAKLILAYREQREALAEERRSHLPRLRAVRIVQDLVELCGDRSDFLLRLGSNHANANVDELHAANVCVLSIALAAAMGFERPDMVDVGVAGLFHDLARTDGDEPPIPPAMISESELVLRDNWDDGAGESAPEPLPEAFLAAAEDEDEAEAVPLPVECIGEGQPLDPSELPLHTHSGFGDTTDVNAGLDDPDGEVERTAVTAAPVMSEPEPAADALEAQAVEDVQVVPLGQSAFVEAPGRPGHAEELWTTNDHPHTVESFARLLNVAGIAPSGLLRAIVAAEHHTLSAERYLWGEMRSESHVYSRVVAVADAYDAMTGGLGSPDGIPIAPIEALGHLLNDRTGRADGRIVDLLINVLRAYPVGAEVVLDTGERAVVVSHAGGTRWDRPFVRTMTDPPRNVDLMMRDGDRFRARILGTVRSLGEREREGEGD